MRPTALSLVLVLTIAGTAVACAPAPASNLDGQGVAPGAPRAPTRTTIASFRELDFTPYSAVPGSYELRNLVNPGLTVVDDRGAFRPVLAEAAPSLENGLWKVFPDGRMETSWKIRSGARWHDGAAFTAQDLAFTIQVSRDRTVGVFGGPAYSAMDEVTVADPQTIVVTWRQPYIDADQTFTIWAGWPLPRHLLEGPYLDDPASVSQLAFWSGGYVGSGPYRLRENVAGLRISLEAFDQFVLGRPKIDEIDVVYTPDPNTVLANILAGTADLTLGIGLSVDSAVDLRDRWREGKMSFEFSDQRWFRLDPQFIDPNPTVVTDLRFRRALLHAIDRQELADSLQAGLSPVAHTFMAPDQPDYAGIDARVLKYEYDPRKAVQMIEELGYRRGPDGAMRDASGRAIELEIAGANEAVTKTMLAVGDYWQRIGVATNPFIVPPQRATDWPWRATFAAFALFTGTHDIAGLPAFRSNQARTAANNYEVSGLPNWPRYQNGELDELVNRFFRTIPKQERIGVITQINVHIAENLNTIGLYYFPIPYAVADRVVNVPTNRASRASLTWNAHLWDVRR